MRPGRATRWTFGALVVGPQRRLELCPAIAECVVQRLRDPPRVGGGDRQMTDRVDRAGRRDPAHPAVLVVLGDLAQHGVHEAGRARARTGEDEFDGGRDRGMRWDASAQQLVRAQPERVVHRTVEGVQRAVGTAADDRVEQAERAAAAVGEVGGQRRVAAEERASRDDARQREIGVRTVLPNGGEQVEGCEAGAVRLGRPALAGLVAGRWPPLRMRHDASSQQFAVRIADAPRPVCGRHLAAASRSDRHQSQRSRTGADQHVPPPGGQHAWRQVTGGQAGPFDRSDP